MITEIGAYGRSNASAYANSAHGTGIGRESTGKTDDKKTNETEFSRNPTGNSKTSLTMNDFFKLMAAQMANQDMNNPMDNSEMLQQLTQMATVEAMAAMQLSVENSAAVATTTYATNLLGQQVRVADINEDTGQLTGSTVGQVTGVDLYNGAPRLFVNGKAYYTTQIMGVGETEEPDIDKPENPDKPEEPDKPSKPEEGTGGPGESTEKPGGGSSTEGGTNEKA